MTNNILCCDTSHIWEGESVGYIDTFEQIEIYVSKPELRKTSIETQPESTSGHPISQEKKRVILFLTEGHGIYLPNAQLLADSFASHLNCDVIMPDEFAGQARLPKSIVPSIPPGSNFEKLMPWTEDKDDVNYSLRGLPLPRKENPESDPIPFLKPPSWKEEGEKEFENWKARHEPPVTDPILEKVIQYIHKIYGAEVSIGGVGYCFGGRYVIRLLGAGTIRVGVVNHPSFFTMEEVAKLGEGMMLSIFSAETDEILPPEKRRATEDVLSNGGATFVSTVFSGTEHGFSVRGNLQIQEIRFAKEEAFQGAVKWFQTWL